MTVLSWVLGVVFALALALGGLALLAYLIGREDRGWSRGPSWLDRWLVHWYDRGRKP